MSSAYEVSLLADMKNNIVYCCGVIINTGSGSRLWVQIFAQLLLSYWILLMCPFAALSLGFPICEVKIQNNPSYWVITKPLGGGRAGGACMW